MRTFFDLLLFLPILLLIDHNLNAAVQSDRNIPMILEFNTALDGYEDYVVIPFSGEVDLVVEWGDGHMIHADSEGCIMHRYEEQGVYKVKITGSAEVFGGEFGYQYPPFLRRLIRVNSYGDLGLTALHKTYQNSTALYYIPESFPLTVTELSYLFFGNNSAVFDTSQWDMSNITNISGLFANLNNFNQDISSWNVTNITNMESLFLGSTSFNQNIGSWNVSNVTNMKNIFSGATSFNQDIGNWDLSNVVDTSGMFRDCYQFNQDIGGWNLSNVVDMEGMFEGAVSFDQDISLWDVSSVTDMGSMFKNMEIFNQNIGSWDVSSVTTMAYMFEDNSSFNQDIGDWDLSNVVDITGMFKNSLFNSDINGWDVSGVTIMEKTFYNSQFNSPLNLWDVSSVTNMKNMFTGAVNFNQDISSWDTSNVTDMRRMFQNGSSFNQNISSWDVSNVEKFNDIFRDATSFDQNLGDWDLSSATSLSRFFRGIELSTVNYDSTLIGWAENINTPDSLTFSGGLSRFSDLSEPSRQFLIEEKSWEIEDGGYANGDVEESLTINGCELYQNYPNPFNPTTTISFNIPAKPLENLALLLFNVKGELVDEYNLVDLKQGINTIKLNMSNHSSGTFFYKLEGDKFNDVRKMVLSK